jgi:osmoprotectant transport system substrate-binding protein
MYAGVGESRIEIQRNSILVAQPVAQGSYKSGQIDLYPEYTGTGLLTILKLPASSNQKQVF